MCISVFPILLLIIGLVIILPIVLICVLLGKRREQATVYQVQSQETIDPSERNRKREAILNQLATKEITKEDAEQQLLELDNPVPEQLPVAPAPPRNGCGTGCLIAVICAIVAIAILFLLFFGTLTVSHRSTSQYTTYQHEVG